MLQDPLETYQKRFTWRSSHMSKAAVPAPRFANYKNHIKLNFDAMVAG